MKSEHEQVELLNEEGRALELTHYLTFFHNGEKYVALSPSSENDDEIVLLHIVSGDDGDIYEIIENEVLLNEVFDVFVDLMEEMEEDDEEDA